MRLITIFALLITCLFHQGALEAKHRDKDQAPPVPRDYYKALTDNDKENISYIVTTLATKSYLSLLFQKGRLERTGEKTAHIHPLRYLGFVFSDPTLRVHIRKIGGLPWKRFVEGFAESLETESSLANLKDEHIEDFSALTDVDSKLIFPPLREGRWTEFMETMVSY